jgi:5-methylcytosine-specific restriction endonuclease McrA
MAEVTCPGCGTKYFHGFLVCPSCSKPTKPARLLDDQRALKESESRGQQSRKPESLHINQTSASAKPRKVETYYKKRITQFKGKKWYVNLGLKDLEGLRQKNQDKIERLRAEIQNLDRSISMSKSLENGVSEFQQKIDEIYRMEGSTLRYIFLNSKLDREADARVMKLVRQRNELYEKIKETGGDSKTLEMRRRSKESELNKLEQYNQTNEARIKSLIREAEREERKKKHREVEKAKLAQFDGKTRGLAESIKNKLERHDLCPYCGGDIGDIPHADHIFPVKYGGMSAHENMVYVCSDCNMKKRDLTLREFCREYQYDFEKIEDRLEKLGKKF